MSLSSTISSSTAVYCRSCSEKLEESFLAAKNTKIRIVFQTYSTKKKEHETTITRLLERDEHETNTSMTWLSSHKHTSTQ